jgi:hypothetical protein
MSVPFDPKILTRRTEANLTSKEWFLVIAVDPDETDLAGATSGATGDLCIGALTNDVGDGSSTAIYVPVQVGGIIKAVCGDACTAGSLAMADENGEAMDATTGKYAFGIALNTYVDGEVGAFLWAPSYYEEG